MHETIFFKNHLLPGNFVVTIPTCQTVIRRVPTGRSHNSLSKCTNWWHDMKKSFILAVHETEHHWIGRRDEAGKSVHAFEALKRTRCRYIPAPQRSVSRLLVSISCSFRYLYNTGNISCSRFNKLIKGFTGFTNLKYKKRYFRFFNNLSKR